MVLFFNLLQWVLRQQSLVLFRAEFVPILFSFSTTRAISGADQKIEDHLVL